NPSQPKVGNMRCSNCGNENPASKRFCEDCGAPLANRCPKCGAETTAGKRFCGNCGLSLSLPVTFSEQISDAHPVLVSEAPDPERLEGERKTVTALFADIKGSMELMEDLDPEEARAIV